MVTRSPFTHVRIMFGGKCYHSYAWWHSGTRHLLHGFGYGAPVAERVLEPIVPMDNQERRLMREYIGQSMLFDEPYNFLSLVSLAIVYPTRWFWRWIGKVPFSADVLGKVCSTKVDHIWKRAGRDLFPDDLEDYTVPGDFRQLTDPARPEKIRFRDWES